MTDFGNTDRFHLLPLKHPEIYHFYTLFKSLFWTPAEVDTSKDRKAYLALEPEAQTYLRNILAFFSDDKEIKYTSKVSHDILYQ